jgi:hypothetical protein
MTRSLMAVNYDASRKYECVKLSLGLGKPPLDDEVSPLYIAKFAHSLQEAALK